MLGLETAASGLDRFGGTPLEAAGWALRASFRSKRVHAPQPGTARRQGHSLRFTRSAQGFTLIELIVVLTAIGLLIALAVVSYMRLTNDAKIAKSNNLVTTIATAKAMFVADQKTTPADIAAFNSAPEDNAATILKYIRVNGAQPKDVNDLLALSGITSDGVTIRFGTVDDGSGSGGTAGQAPTVTGYGYSSPLPSP